MNIEKVNYDNIAPNYNLRYRNNKRPGTLKALKSLLSETDADHILEVGCGTGHWLEGLACPQKALCGLDASMSMLKQLSDQKRIALVQGRAACLPFENDCFDLITCINALHHFSDTWSFLRESYRVLHSGGTLAIIGMDPRDSRNRWYLYDFFEGTRERDLARFPSWEDVRYGLSEIGFVRIYFRDVDFIHDPKTQDSVLSDPFLMKDSCSQLALLSETAYQQGLQRIKASLVDPETRERVYENQIVLSMMMATKPSSLTHDALIR